MQNVNEKSESSWVGENSSEVLLWHGSLTFPTAMKASFRKQNCASLVRKSALLPCSSLHTISKK